MKYTNIFYAKYPSRDKQYIFELPYLDTKVAKGDKLRVIGKNGTHDVIASSGNWIVTEDIAKDTASAMGGYWPLAQAVGKIEHVSKEVYSSFISPSERRNADMSKPCKYESEDGICINADCPMCCDYCPIPDDIPNVCKWEDRNTKENECK